MTDAAADFLERHGLVRTHGSSIPGTAATVAELVDHAAARYGDRVAVVDDRGGYRFSELPAVVDRAAGAYLAAGLEPLDRVAVALPNSTDVVIAFLAAMRAGLIWVGINAHLAAPEKRFLLHDSGARLLVTDARGIESLRGEGEAITVLAVDQGDRGGWFASQRPARFDPAGIDPFGPAAIAYTSGTTGQPKGAVHSQHNMLMPGAIAHWRSPEPLVHGVILPLTILNLQILGPVHALISGSTLVPLPRIDVLGVAEGIKKFGVQRMSATPPTVYDLLTRPDIDPADLASLTNLGVGGAKAPAGMRERYRERFGRDFVVGYGLTEAPTVVTGSAEGDRPAPLGSAGRASPHLTVTIRDASGAVLPAGAEGEICVGSVSTGTFAGCYTTMLGYWDRPEATASALRDGVLHTGDIGVLDDDGCLWVRDRRSDLIIRGGANVYPAEVERVVEATGLVAEVSVVGREDDRLGEEVVAFVAPAPGTTLDVAALDEACRSQLAGYKIPVTWYEVAEFPRNAMGKVMNPQLRAWLRDGAAGASAKQVGRPPSPKRRSVRLAEDEAWETISASHTGIFTTLRRDGVPIALPVWFVVHDRRIYLSTPSGAKKAARVRSDARASFLVESGERWAELKAVHLTGTAAVVEPEAELDEAVQRLIDAKYGAFRTRRSTMPAATREHYSSGRALICFTPDERMLTWDNARLFAD